jgi:hypothetical protein
MIRSAHRAHSIPITPTLLSMALKTTLRRLSVLAIAFLCSLGLIGPGFSNSATAYAIGPMPVALAAATTAPATTAPATTAPASAAAALASGKYPVQQAEYDDVDGTYTLLLLNTPAGVSSAYRTQTLPMAQLTEDEVKAGERSYLTVAKDEGSLHLAADFRIDYVHNETETQTNAATGAAQTVVVRRESSFWSPFMGAVAGQAIGNALFAPRYYFPPTYTAGRGMVGYGGTGATYDRAVDHYRSQNNTVPPAVRNREKFRSTGQLRRSTGNGFGTKIQSPSAASNAKTRSSGSGFGTSTLRTSGAANSRPNTGFGSQNRSSQSRPGNSGSAFGSSRRSSPARMSAPRMSAPRMSAPRMGGRRR